MLKLAQSEMPVALDDLDCDPYLLNVKNGTLDLRTGKLKPHDRDDRITKLVPIDFDPNAKCPTFNTFLLEVCGGDVGLRDYLQRVIGYSLTGITKEQNLWILYGLGSNGKTTFIDIVKKVAGVYGRTADISTFTYKQSEHIRNDLARLFDARLVTSVEIQEGKLLDESVIKQVTGGDPVTSRFLFKEHFEYIPKFKLFMVVNHLPHINGTDRGIWRRIKVIPFTVSFEGKKKDKDLLSKLEKELSGILNWTIEGCLMWQREGLNEPDCVRAAGERYQRDEDSIEDFLAENTEKNPELKVRSMDLFKRDSEIQRELGMKVMSQKLFAQKLAIKGYEKKRDSKGRIEYLGLCLKSHPRSAVC
jgi:putative DNA primase/helicase